MLVLRQRAKEKIDGQAVAARCRGLQQLQCTVQKRHIAVRRDDIGAVGLHVHAVLHLKNLHAGITPDQLGENAFMVGGQVLHDHKSHARIGVGRHAGKKGLECREAPGRSANAHDGEAGNGAIQNQRWATCCLGWRLFRLYLAVPFCCHARSRQM